MLKEKEKNFWEIFLEEFVIEILRNTKSYENELIKQKVKKIDLHQEKEKNKKEKEKEDLIREIVYRKIKEDKEKLLRLKKEEDLRKINFNQRRNILKRPGINKLEKPFFNINQKNLNSNQKEIIRRTPLRINVPKLPSILYDVKPVPSEEFIDLGKLNPLINDPAVKMIECFGPDEKIFVNGRMGRKITSITLTKDDIEKIISIFAKETKMPVHEGLFKAIFGNLTLLAEIPSKQEIPIKFVLKKVVKMMEPPTPPNF